MNSSYFSFFVCIVCENKKYVLTFLNKDECELTSSIFNKNVWYSEVKMCVNRKNVLKCIMCKLRKLCKDDIKLYCQVQPTPKRLILNRYILSTHPTQHSPPTQMSLPSSAQPKITMSNKGDLLIYWNEIFLIVYYSL